MSTPETPQPVLPYIRPEIAVLPPYKQGTQADGQAFKLSSNENPFEPLPGVLSAVRAEASIHRYPDATAGRLRAALAERFGVDIDSVHIGAGSVAIIAQFMLAVSAPGDEIMFAWRSFEAYPGLALVAGATPVQVPLTEDSRHDLPAMLAAINDRTRAVIVCSPNNPTGPAVTQAEFDDFLAQVPPTVLVILDEAYVEFVTHAGVVNGASMIAAGAPANLVVLRTFSKAYGLAGLRVGYAIGHPRVLDAARSTGIPLSVTAQAETGALASLAAEAELLERVYQIAQHRDEMVTALREQGWRVPDAQGNFVWLATGAGTMAAAETFLQAGLVVRAFDGEGIRISVGEHMSVEKVLLAARGIVDNLPNAHPARR